MCFISFHQLRPAEIKIVSCSIYFFISLQTCIWLKYKCEIKLVSCDIILFYVRRADGLIYE